MRSILRLIVAIVFMGLAALFAFAFHERYWRWRDCFNELGRCYDPASQHVYLEQAGIAWGGLTVLCLAVGVVVLLRRD